MVKNDVKIITILPIKKRKKEYSFKKCEKNDNNIVNVHKK